MFHDSVDGKAYDADKYASYYKPYNLRTEGDDTRGGDTAKAPVRMPTRNMNIQAPKADEDDVPFEVTKPMAKVAPAEVADEAPKKLTSPEDILAAIRKRQAAKA